jgi:hypothetical protein
VEIKLGVTVKVAIELLAFMLLAKNAHSNSVLFKTSAHRMAAEIGMSDGRILKKYLTKCIDMGLCIEEPQSYKVEGGRTIYKFIAYADALSSLLDLKESELRYFPLHKNVGNFKAYQYQIERDLCGLRFAQQDFKSNSDFPNKTKVISELNELAKQPVSVRTARATKAKRRKLLKKYQTAESQAQFSRHQGHVNGVVTGCNNLAKTIGKSSTTAFKRFIKWEAEGKIELHNIVFFTPCRSAQEAALIIDSFKQQKVAGIHIYSKKEQGIKTIRGKKVIGFSSAKYSYKDQCYDSSSLTFSKSQNQKKYERI